MKWIALIVLLCGIFGAVFLGVGRCDETEFWKMNIGDTHHALAAIIVGTLAAICIVDIPKTKFQWAIIVPATIVFICSFVILLVDMTRLDKIYWIHQPFLTFTILVAGGLICMAISSVKRK